MPESMSDVVTYEVTEDGIAIIRANNPPVNALGYQTRLGLWNAIETFDGDASAKIALIHCDGRTFFAGADISEFGGVRADPLLPQVCDRYEAATKPVVASMHGTSLGGGFEMGLASHYRIAQKKSKVGLPEVHLGIIPGAGGTQRAPRVMGAANALEAITTGRHMSAVEAFELGAIDRLDDSGDPLAAGLAYCRELLAEGAGPRRTGERPVPDATPELFAEWTEKAKKTAKGQNSPLYCVEAVAGCMLPIGDGLAVERAVSAKTHSDPQRPALVHAFFGERAVNKIPEAKATPRKLEKIGIIGGGTMGAGIAAAALNAGLNVVMVEMNAEAVARGEKNLRRNYASSVAKGRMSQDGLDKMLGAKFSTSDSYDALADVDLVIEAVFEKMEVKKEVFARIDAIVRDGAVLASNTSYLDVDEIAACTRRPQDVIGLHFFSPAHIMRLLEVVVGDKTAPEVVATGFALAKMMKKVAVRAGVCDGFIGNRILGAYLKAANMMVVDGASPYAVDKAVRAFGYPMGPFQMGDLAGLDIGYFTRRSKDAARDPAEVYKDGFLDRMYDEGWLGQKTEKGFYDYAGGARSGPPNPGVEPMIAEERGKLDIQPREFTDAQIMRRYIAAMTNEAAKVVGEGIALRPVDVDMTALFGYGYPRWRGGPMHHADHVGLDVILKDIREFEKDDPAFWEPAPLLVKLVEEGKTFADLNKA